MNRPLPFFTASAMAALLSASAPAAPIPVADITREGPVDFAKDIHPLLKRSCLACHNTTKAKAGLNLESPEAILKGGDSGPAAIAGKGKESLLVLTAAHAEDPAMPPPGNKVNAPNFSPEELGLLQLWINQGLKGSAVTETVSNWRPFPTGAAPVSAAAVSPQGRLAAAARGNEVVITEVATGLPVGHLTDPELAKEELYKDRHPADRDAVLSLAFGSDDLIASGGFRTARLWRRQPLLPSHSRDLPAPATAVAATHEIAASGDATGLIQLWNPADPAAAPVDLREHQSPIRALAFSPDGSLLVSAGEDGKATVWSVTDHKAVFSTTTPAPLTSLCFLQNGSALATVASDGTLRVYPFPASPPATPPAPSHEHKFAAPPTAVATLDPAGSRLVWADASAALHWYDAADGKAGDITLENPATAALTATELRLKAAQRLSEAHTARRNAAAEAHKKEQEALVASHQAREKARTDLAAKQEAARSTKSAAAAAPDDKARTDTATKAASEAEASLRAFTDARTNAELAVRLTGQAAQALTAAEANAAAAAAAVTEITASLEAARKALPAPVSPIGLASLHGGKVLTIACRGGRLQWHSADGAFLDAADGPLAPDATILLAASSQAILLARPDRKALLCPPRRPFALERTIGNPNDPAILASRTTALAFSSDARLLATGGGVPSRQGEVRIWNTSDGAPVLTLQNPHSDTVNALAFSPDDTLLATAGSDRWTRIFRTDDGSRTHAFEGHSAAVLSVAWRCDGLALATGSADKTLRLWDVAESKQIKALSSFTKEVSALSWLGSSDAIASASGDEGVRINEEKLPGSKSFCFTLAADPHGRILAVGGEDGILRLWNASDKKLLWEAAGF
ncbi:MAG: Chromosome partition protein Smc [Verrucomicrobiota bacterium]|jgi:WD40 repeat protein